MVKLYGCYVSLVLKQLRRTVFGHPYMPTTYKTLFLPLKKYLKSGEKLHMFAFFEAIHVY